MSSQKCVEPDFALENQRFENSAAQMGLSLEKLPGGFYVSAPTQKAWASWVLSAAARLNSDKPRMDFESSPQFRGMDFTRSSSHPDYYESPYANGAWNGWKASRESLVIELPPAPSVPEDPEEAIDDSHMDGYNAAVRMRSACEKSIKAAGLKVKP